MIQIVPYQRKYDEDIRKLCRIPVSGNIALALEREPSYLTGARVQCEQEEVYVALDPESHKVWAAFNVGKRRLWYQKRVTEARYLCDLRIHPEKQNSSLLFSIIKKYRELSQNDSLPAQTVVFADNHRMNAFITRISKGQTSGSIPYYHHVGALNTYLLPVGSRKKEGSTFHIRKARESDIAIMQNLMDKEGSKINYFPYYDFSELHRDYYHGLSLEDHFLLFKGPELVGMAAIWDQSAFKQTRIKGYSPLFRIIRPAYNLFRGLSFRSTLPASGSVLKYGYLHGLLIKNRIPGYFEVLLEHIQGQLSEAKYDHILCSLDQRDPLHRVPEKLGFFRKIKGNYFLVNRGQDLPKDLTQPCFYLEGARI